MLIFGVTDNRNYFVKLWYLNNHTTTGFNLSNTTSLLIPKTIPNCPHTCPLEQFIKWALQKYLLCIAKSL